MGGGLDGEDTGKMSIRAPRGDPAGVRGYSVFPNKKWQLTPLEPQSRFGDKLLEI